MADRKDFYYRQKVTEAELDGAFDGLEVADRNMVGDLGFAGIASGLAAVQHTPSANLGVDVSAGTAYDQSGQRIRVPSVQAVSVATDNGGVSTAVATPGNAKVVSVFLRFTRSLSDPRIDGNSNTVYFLRDESFGFWIKQGVEALDGAEVAPGLEADKLLICDVKLISGQTSVVTADITTTRKQNTFKFPGATYALNAQSTGEALEDLLGFINGISIGGLGGVSAGIVSASIAATWADATGIVGTDVDAALEEIVTDLATDGDAKLAAAAHAGTYNLTVNAGTIRSQIGELQAAIDLGPRGVAPTTTAANLALTTERSVFVDVSGGPVTITAPDPAGGRFFRVKNTAGDPSVNAISIAAFGAELIEGAAGPRVLSTQGGEWLFESDGTNWWMG